MSSLKFSAPSLENLREKVNSIFGVIPCPFQEADALAQLKQTDVITIAPTGAGKTLTFWMPLLFNGGGIIIIITALNILGDQNIEELRRLGIKAVNITGTTASNAVFQDMERLEYRVIIVSPEIILRDARFNKLWNSSHFMSHLFNISIDEAHCVSQWGKSFRPEYADLGQLRWLLPSVRFHLVSATMPELVLNDVRTKLLMKKEKTRIIRCSNDRPNIHIMVEEMKYSPNGIDDLERILRLHAWGEDGPQSKFMIFTNKRKEAEHEADLAREILAGLSPDLREKIVWFHSGMSAAFREEAITGLRSGIYWGFFCTDAAGMGLDLPDVDLVVQFRYTESLSTLMQRMGRGGRQRDTEATGIYLVEPQYFDHAKKKVIGKRKRNLNEVIPGPQKQKQRRDNESTALGMMERDERDNNTEAEEVEDELDTGVDEDTYGEEEEPWIQPFVSKDMISLELPSPYGQSEEHYESLVMDLFINARERGYCRRLVMNKYFGNYLADPWECDCGRCVPVASRLCCDGCCPDRFILMALAQPSHKATRAKRKLKFKNYTMDSHDRALFQELDKWRTKTAEQEEIGDDDYFGALFIATDDILERIVLLVHHSKLPDVKMLAAQTNWRYAHKYGDNLLTTVAHFLLVNPPPLPPNPPPPQATTAPSTSENHGAVAAALGTVSQNTTSTVPSISKTTRVRHCSACGAIGHIANNHTCPKFQSATKNSETENTQPAAQQTTRAARKCRICGAAGHISSSRACPQWLPIDERKRARQAKTTK
ncbi:P-loop containing nucleoside triphosphate hydrolase protein [Crepidotus variabilis]|uniref:DNA 3'-5' helicase n=1 Tax=Crepidotus variabilis TaxID=179855 RepID=A0A9P6JMB6_9AGAR|nr:P-loop containing nucleoside triphosphate hydrolase protein [Crepidotus variabilis]